MVLATAVEHRTDESSHKEDTNHCTCDGAGVILASPTSTAADCDCLWCANGKAYSRRESIRLRPCRREELPV